MGALYWAGIALPAGGGVIALARHPVFSSAKTVKNSRAHCVTFYIDSASPCAETHCSALGLAVGFRPPRPRLSGVSCTRSSKRVNGGEPLRHGLPRELSTTLSFGIGAGDGNRTRVPSLEGWCSAIERRRHEKQVSAFRSFHPREVFLPSRSATPASMQ